MVHKEIEARSMVFRCFSIKHEHRESNRDAHSLVKAVVSLSVGRHVWLLDRLDIIVSLFV
jgi:hypothetical protein